MKHLGVYLSLCLFLTSHLAYSSWWEPEPAIVWVSASETIFFDDAKGIPYILGNGRIRADCSTTYQGAPLSTSDDGVFQIPINIGPEENTEKIAFRCAGTETGEMQIHYRWLKTSPFFTVRIQDDSNKGKAFSYYDHGKLVTSEWLVLEEKLDSSRDPSYAFVGLRHFTAGADAYLSSSGSSLFPLVGWRPAWRWDDSFLFGFEARITAAVFRNEEAHPVALGTGDVTYLWHGFDVSLGAGLEVWTGVGLTGPTARLQLGNSLATPWWGIERFFVEYGFVLFSGYDFHNLAAGLSFSI